MQKRRTKLVSAEQWPNFSGRVSIITSYQRTCWLMEFCCSQQPSGRVTYGRHWLVDSRAQIWKGTYQEHSLKQKLACFTSISQPCSCSSAPYFVVSLPPHTSYSPPHAHPVQPFLNHHSLVSVLCNCSWNEQKKKKKVFQRSPFLCGLHPVFFFLSLICMVTVIQPFFEVKFIML